MYIDAMTLAAIADEWRALLIGARIDTVIQPTEHAVAIQCYAPQTEGQGGKNRWLYLSAHPQLARAHVTALKPPKIASEPPPFVMLLRKYLEGARIEAIVQPAWERVIEIVAGYRVSPDSEERVRFHLIIEIMGKLSNIVFCNDEMMILGSVKRVGSDVNRYREIAAGIPYVPPPPQQRTLAGQVLPRLLPTTVTAAQLAISVAEQRAEAESSEPPVKKKKKSLEQMPVTQILLNHLAGCSPQVAREVVYRTTERVDTLVPEMNEDLWEELAWNTRDLASAYEQHHWHPQLIERPATPEERQAVLLAGHDIKHVPVAFSVYPLEQYADIAGVIVRESPSINVLIDDYYARSEWRDALDSLRSPLRKVLQHQLERCQRKTKLLEQDMAASQEADQYRLFGELLIAQQETVPQGPQSIRLENYFVTDQDGTFPLVDIPLDPRFNAVNNANRYFQKYHKLRRALELIPGQMEENNVELATITQLLADLMLAENAAEIALVKAEIQTAGYIRGKSLLDKKQLKQQKKGGSKKQAKGKVVPPGGGVPLSVRSHEGFTLLIGKNSRQNEEVTFHQATGNDIWLHARGVAGAHVIIKGAGRDVPKSTIDQAANLAAYYSEARGSTSAPVDYTLQRHVRHMKGAGPGMVIYERERTLYARPDQALRP